MKAVFTKAFTLTFYKAFIGFFILLLIVFGSFMRVTEHIMLAQFILHSPFGLASALFLFTLYAYFEMNFRIKLSHSKEYLIFHQTGLFSRAQFFKTHLYIWVYNHLLIVIYSLFLTYQGLITENVNIVVIFSIWLVLILLFIGSTTYQFHLLKKPLPEYKFKKVKFRWFMQSKITRVFWFPIHLLQERPLLFIGSKFTSLLLLNIFFSSYLAGGYDERWLFFSITCSAYLNTMIWSEKASFEQKKLSYFLNMPLDIKSKIFNHHLVFLMILIPEFLIILYQSNYNVLSLFSLIAIALASNAGLYALFNLIIDENNFSRVIFFTFFLFFFLILFGIPAVVLILICYLPFMYLFKSPYQI